MALQVGMGLSRILILSGAVWTGGILLKNGKLSDVVGELQSMIKRIEKSTGEVDSDSNTDDAITAQVHRLAMEIRQIGSRPITVLNGSSGNGTALILPVAALGVLGYGYMKWKGLSFSDLMYVTVHNMTNAVSNLTKHLEQVSDALATAKKHLTRRIENVDDKLKSQIEISKHIKQQVGDVQKELSQVGWNLDDLQTLVSGLEGKKGALEEKQDVACTGVLYLCEFVNGKKGNMPRLLQNQLRVLGRSCSLPTSKETISLKGLKDLQDIADNLIFKTKCNSATDLNNKDGICQVAEPATVSS